MARHRIHSLSFKKQIVQEYAAGATLNGLAREHDVSRNLIRGGRPNQLWVADITCDAIATGFVYLAAIGDLGGECRVAADRLFDGGPRVAATRDPTIPRQGALQQHGAITSFRAHRNEMTPSSPALRSSS